MNIEELLEKVIEERNNLKKEIQDLKKEKEKYQKKEEQYLKELNKTKEELERNNRKDEDTDEIAIILRDTRIAYLKLVEKLIGRELEDKDQPYTKINQITDE